MGEPLAVYSIQSTSDVGGVDGSVMQGSDELGLLPVLTCQGKDASLRLELTFLLLFQV